MRSAAPTRRAGVVAGAAVLALVLTGCGANFNAQTYQQRNIPDGTNAATGAIALRNVHVVAPKGEEPIYRAGDDVELRFTLTNDGPEDDRLLEITSPDAGSVRITEQGGGDVRRVPLPRLSTTANRYGAVLEGLSEDLRPGQYVEVTFRFDRAPSITVQAPIAVTGEYDENRERSEHFHPIGEHGGEAEHGEGEGEHDSQETGGQGGGSLREAGEETQDAQEDKGDH